MEEIVEKGSLLYNNGRELPLNSSFASNNVQEGDILESCSSPFMSSLLSAVLQDLNSIERITEHERTQDKMQPLLGGAILDPWPNRWSFDAIKTRKICLATMKMVLQRDGRFNLRQIPKITTLQELYDFMQTIWNTGNNNRRHHHNSMAHVFKPSAKNSNGKPSICWQLMDHKYKEAQRMRRSTENENWIEAFVQRENSRHNRVIETPPTTTKRRNNSNADATPRLRRGLLPSPASTATTPCTNCNQLAECTCLEESCPFFQQFCCTLCFIGNHPRHIRNHPRVELADPRVKTVLKERNKPGYCPEYQSGPFAILCTLFEASEGQSSHRRELSLSESRLKKIAQTRCRSNLYDRQARGRSAFACIESLADKQLVRKELIPGHEEARFSLLPEGEAMAKLCRTFEATLDEVLREKTTDVLRQPYNKQGISLIVDTREDATYAERLLEHCRDRGVPCDKRELPAGDYLFTTKSSNGEENVLPLVIERKSWSDLADSVSGAGKGHRRLDCVRVGGNEGCSSGRCQLCRMKASGCSKVMFVIEGARCLNRDGEDKCNDTKRCQYCKELTERHSLIHEELEAILYQLQAEHGCLIHFTRGYNETIESLQIMHRILVCQRQNGVEDDPDLARAIQLSLGASGAVAPTNQEPILNYKQFCSNARRSRSNEGMRNFGAKKGKVKRLRTESFIRGIHDDKVLSIFSSNQGGAPAVGVENLDRAFSKTTPAEAEVEILEIDSENERGFNASQESIFVLEENEVWTSSKGSTNQSIEIDSDDNGEPSAKQQKRGKDGDIVVLEAGADDDESIPFFIITGLYEYDRDYYRDINKVWQSACRSEASKSRNDFRLAVLEHLRSIQTDELPLVKRESILYWALKIQLCSQALLHAARESDSFHQLQYHWNTGVRAQGSTNDISVQDCTSRRHATPPARARRQTPQQASPKTPPVYTIDDDPVPVPPAARRGSPESAAKQKVRRQTPPQASPKTTPVYTIDDDPVPVPPATTRGSAQRKARRQKTQASPQTTPVCTIDDDPVPVPRIARPRSPVPVARRKESPRAGWKAPPVYDIKALNQPANRDSQLHSKEALSDSQTDAKIREARLRRFVGTSNSACSTSTTGARASHPNSTSANRWSCETCTIMNEKALSKCKMCGAKKKKGWACNNCTYENGVDAERCKMCGRVNETGMVDIYDHLEASRPMTSTNEISIKRRDIPPRPPADVASSRKRQRRTPAKPTVWSCGNCTFENEIHVPRCKMCENQNPSVATGDSLTGRGEGGVPFARSPQIPSTAIGINSTGRGEGGVPFGRSPQIRKASSDKTTPTSDRPKSRVRCGACGQEGHNRGTGKPMLLVHILDSIGS